MNAEPLYHRWNQVVLVEQGLECADQVGGRVGDRDVAGKSARSTDNNCTGRARASRDCLRTGSCGDGS